MTKEMNKHIYNLAPVFIIVLIILAISMTFQTTFHSKKEIPFIF